MITQPLYILLSAPCTIPSLVENVHRRGNPVSISGILRNVFRITSLFEVTSGNQHLLAFLYRAHVNSVAFFILYWWFEALALSIEYIKLQIHRYSTSQNLFPAYRNRSIYLENQ